MDTRTLLWNRMRSQIWFRATTYVVAALLLAGAVALVSLWAPPDLRFSLGEGAVGDLLTILASSMLAVTTFSVSAMVAAYSAAADSGTARSTQLLISDHHSQRALSTFVGVFAFAVVGLVVLSFDGVTETARTLLFLGTVVVIALVVITLLQWISFLAGFGRLADILERVESAASSASSAYAEAPLKGGAPWVDVPLGAAPVMPLAGGYVTHVDVQALQQVAQGCGARMWVRARAGTRSLPDVPLAHVVLDNDSEVRDIEEEVAPRIRAAFLVEKQRRFEEDPRFGLLALAEIGSRAMSQGINDPGTAIAVYASMQRSMDPLVRTSPTRPGSSDGSVVHDRVHVVGLTVDDFVNDAWRAASTEAAGTFAVTLRLQREIGSLLRVAHPDWHAALIRVAKANRRAAAELLVEEFDQRELATVHEDVLARRVPGP